MSKYKPNDCNKLLLVALMHNFTYANYSAKNML